MALWFFRIKRKDDVTSRRHSDDEDPSHAAKSEGESQRMTLCRKLMLCAEFMGMEARTNFQQIYTIPILGMPVSLSYIEGLVSGPSAILLLPLLGWLVDRGGNPQNRKTASVVLAASVQILGVLCLLWANTLHLRYLLDYQLNDTEVVPVSRPNMNGSGLPVVDPGVLSKMLGKDVGRMDQNSNVTAVSVGAFVDATNGSSERNSTGSFTVPFKAGLGMFGFILMDLGFDLSNCFVKALVVSCCAREEQMSLIVLGVVMGAIGGVTNAVLGLVDFTSLLGLTSIEGAELIIQTSVQGLLIIMTVITGLLFTLCTGRKQLRDLQKNSPGTTSSAKHQETRNGIDPRTFHENGTLSCNESSIHSYDDDTLKMNSLGGNNIHLDSFMTLEEKNSSFWSEEFPLLEDTLYEEEEYGDPVTSHSFGSYSAVESADEEETSLIATSMDNVGESHPEEGKRSRPSCVQNPKVRIFLVCLTTFFSANMMLLFTASVSDFLGKGVYGGDPAAEPGSLSLIRYQEGIKMASWVLIVYFITYLVASVAHSSVLDLLGFRAEFTLLQTLHATIGLVTALTLRLEAVLVLSVVAGMTRTCFYAMPYAVTNDIAQTLASTSSGRSPVGLALSLVAASIPLSSCLLFTWVGAIEELTGDVSAPLWIGSASGFLSIVIFLFVGKV